MVQTKNKGSIVEQIIRERGYKLTLIAERMHMSRASLYKKFKSDDLTDLFLFNLGKVIDVDFSKIFPELEHSVFYQSVTRKFSAQSSVTPEDLVELHKKYAEVLEDYNRLLKFLVELVNENELYSIKKEISNFVNEFVRKKDLPKDPTPEPIQ